MTKISRSSFSVINVNATAFLSHNILSAKSVYRKLSDDWLTIFDADPLIIPLPQELGHLPPGFPFLVLKSSTDQWSCTFTSEKISIQYIVKNDIETLPPIDIYNKACKFITEIITDHGVKINRLAGVITRCTQRENPGIDLASHFCQKKWLTTPFNRPENFEIHSHKKYLYDADLEVNSWVRCKSAILAENNAPIIVVEQDINTLSEDIDSKNFSASIIEKFYKDIPNQFDSIFDLYFPL